MATQALTVNADLDLPTLIEGGLILYVVSVWNSTTSDVFTRLYPQPQQVTVTVLVLRAMVITLLVMLSVYLLRLAIGRDASWMRGNEKMNRPGSANAYPINPTRA